MFKLDRSKMVTVDGDIIAEQHQQLRNSLSEEKLKEFSEMCRSNDNLIRLKRCRKPTFTDGDVFVLSPVEGIYFYGRILKAKIENPDDPFMSDGMVIFIFKCKTKEKNMENFQIDYSNVLLGPVVVPRQYWTGGWFETIGNVPLTKEEKKLDYGFFKMDAWRKWGYFITANGKVLNHKPKFLAGDGITTCSGVYVKLYLKFLCDPDLLKF